MMTTNLLITVIPITGSVILACLTYFFTKTLQAKTEWQKEKMNHYKVLLAAISDLAGDERNKEDANKRFALAVNTICLVAPQTVVTALMKFHDEIKMSNKNKTIEKHDRLLIELLLAIRKDIGVSSNDSEKTFSFHLVGGPPK